MLSSFEFRCETFLLNVWQSAAQSDILLTSHFVYSEERCYYCMSTSIHDERSVQCAKLTNSKNKHRPVLLSQKNVQSNEKEGLISYLKSLKNYSISFMSDFNRVSHISGGLIFRLYRRSTFVTCQIISPQHVTIICHDGVVQSRPLLHV